MKKTALVTGVAGFIGFHLALRLIEDGYRIIGVDALTEYYDPGLKQARLDIVQRSGALTFLQERIETPGLLTSLMQETRPELVYHLAAQAGVRYSIEVPRDYAAANVAGTLEVLEAARNTPPKHLLIASTSSVYGANTSMPYRETDRTDHQMSFYAATKKATEAMAHSYAHLYGVPTTMLRFFTVYGPWGRPDMALFKFAEAIRTGAAIDVYNNGNLSRDFTFIDDIVKGVTLLGGAVPEAGGADTDSEIAPFRLVNIGNGSPVPLMEFIKAIEAAFGKSPRHNMMPMQPGDVPATWASTDRLKRLTGWSPETSVADGVAQFADWYVRWTGDTDGGPPAEATPGTHHVEEE